MEGKKKNYFLSLYFWHISLSVHPNFEYGDPTHSHTAYFWSTHNTQNENFNKKTSFNIKIPTLHIFEVPMAPKNEKFNKKHNFNIKIHFIKVFIFGCHGYLWSMQCGYGLDEELNFRIQWVPKLELWMNQ